VAEKRFIEPGHFGRGDEVDAEVKLVPAEEILEQGAGGGAELTRIDAAHALAVPYK